MLISCDMGDAYKGFVQDNDPKSATVVELADSYPVSYTHLTLPTTRCV